MYIVSGGVSTLPLSQKQVSWTTELDRGDRWSCLCGCYYWQRPPFFKRFYYLILERGEGRKIERERNIYMRKKYWLVASHTCLDQTPNLQPGHVPWLGIEPATFHFAVRCPTNWATLDRARTHITTRPPPPCSPPWHAFRLRGSTSSLYS